MSMCPKVSDCHVHLCRYNAIIAFSCDSDDSARDIEVMPILSKWERVGSRIFFGTRTRTTNFAMDQHSTIQHYRRHRVLVA